jgi:hypothetical protein
MINVEFIGTRTAYSPQFRMGQARSGSSILRIPPSSNLVIEAFYFGPPSTASRHRSHTSSTSRFREEDENCLPDGMMELPF